jgi:hypothetical protein
MSTNQINVTEKAKNLGLKVSAQLKRCEELDAEAQALSRDRTFAENRNRGLFASQLISEAKSKLIDGKLISGTVESGGAVAIANLAISERWAAMAIDLLNRAQLVIDDLQDIWGNPRPTGGLWDK